MCATLDVQSTSSEIAKPYAQQKMKARRDDICVHRLSRSWKVRCVKKIYIYICTERVYCSNKLPQVSYGTKAQYNTIFWVGRAGGGGYSGSKKACRTSYIPFDRFIHLPWFGISNPPNGRSSLSFSCYCTSCSLTRSGINMSTTASATLYLPDARRGGGTTTQE